MKRFFSLAALACLLTPSLGAQVLDKPAATVRLTKTESVTVSQLQKVVSPLEAQAKRPLTREERRLALDSLVSTLLIVQAAERDKVIVSEAELKASIADYEQSMGTAANLGRAMSDAELQQYLKNNGVAWNDFQKQMKERLTLISYSRAKRKSMIDSIKPVTDEDAQNYYDSNKAKFFMDDMVTLRHIFIDVRQLAAKDDRDKAARHADDILRELKAGGSFGDLVMKYSEDTTSKYKGGEFGNFFRSDAQSRQLFGPAFFDAVFKLKKGDTSGVLPSNVGYHIVQVANKLDAKLLTMSDKVPPQNQVVVRDAIKATLAQQRQADTLQAALNDIVLALKKQAEVKIFEDNLNW
jgi:parvulin-like peptidyl-prolyl isomerase